MAPDLGILTSDALFVSLRQRRAARTEAMSASAVDGVVAKHAAGAGSATTASHGPSNAAASTASSTRGESILALEDAVFEDNEGPIPSEFASYGAMSLRRRST